MTASIKVPAVGFLAMVLVAACAGTVPAPVPASTAPTEQPASQGPGGESSQRPGGPRGTWTGTVTRHFTQSTTTTSESDSTALTVTYDATVTFTSTEVDINAWTLSGPATIKATQSSDYKYHVTSTLGTCDKHYTDEDLAEGSGIADGGFAINDDATYEFNLTVPAFEGGTETAMRDETGCLGASNT